MASMILERDAQIAQLSGLLDETESAGGRVVLVRGEAGIGKSTLINRFLTDSDATSNTLLGACDDLATPQPLAPIWDVARVEPTLVQPMSDGDRRAVMERLLELLSRSLRPTVLVIEDTQWADEATLDLIRFLGRRIARTNALLILTYRDVEVDTEHPLRRVIGELPPQNVVRMPLPRLSAAAVASMIASASLDLDVVLALTDGNPLFVAEVLASGTDAVPLSVKDAVLARASQLSPQAIGVLELVSVAPGELEMSMVDEIAHPSEADLAECVRLGLLEVDDDALSFPHDLQRKAVESSLSSSCRKRLNQCVLDALAPTAGPARLVHHAIDADNVDAIVEFAPRAARAAMAIESWTEAVAHFRILEPHVERVAVAERAALLVDWAVVEDSLDNPASPDIIDRAVVAHRSAGDDRELARALIKASWVSSAHARPAEALAYSSEALTILEPYGPSHDLASSLSLRAFLEFLYRDKDEAVLPFLDRAMLIAEEIGDDRSMTTALNVKAQLIFSRGEMDGLAIMEQTRSRAERDGNHRGEAEALLRMAGMSGDIRDVARAADYAQRARDTAARYELRNIEVASQAKYSEFLLWSGDWAAAEDAATDAIGSSFHAETIATRVLGTIRARRGRSEARTSILRMWSMIQPGDGPWVVDPSAAVLAEYLWLSGDDPADLIAPLRETLELGVELGTPWPSGALSFWMWKLGLLDAAPDGTADFYGWIISGDYEQAAEFWRDKRAPYEVGLALMHGDEAEQIDAIRIFEELGATAIASKVRRALMEGGTTVPRGKSRATRDHAAGLTARQAEVLELLSHGLSNTEIADELFVSHRTVESHVSAILVKLDVTTREAAVATARDREILARPEAARVSRPAGRG